ncbi:hypothetical protein P879_02718 [Paragonimus westermani]|uniref:Peptidase M14 domain-containing protein n=1 Tax=Paragonimus westermani TaxID=34504 RepID=A0A8T0DIS4_9TREM|nr:hypothetical protein P879_02718 [Paragonimus westermani]
MHFLSLRVSYSEIPDSDKIAAVLTARVHPGETNSSWVILGLLRLLTGTSKEAVALRKQFVFRIIPMLNPDGVILGNYRCSVTGSDLNRNYRHPRKDTFPTVWHTRALVQLSQMTSQKVIFCDFHGHSRRNDVFMYGCDSSNRKDIPANGALPQRSNCQLDYLNERILPYLLSKQVCTLRDIADTITYTHKVGSLH